MIYFLQSCSGGPIKIGCTGDVAKRTRELEAHYGRPLALLATMEGGRDTEAAIHERFAHLRFGRTEQFRPAPELMEFISRPLFVNQGDVTLMEVVPDRRHMVVAELTPDLHRLLRKVAADEGVSMAAFARLAMERIIREEAKERGIKL